MAHFVNLIRLKIVYTFILVEVSISISITWRVSLLVDHWVPEGTCSQVLGQLLLIRSVWRASKYSVFKVVILWVYYTIPFGFSLLWHFLVITFKFFKLHVWLRITDEGSVPEVCIWSISLILIRLKMVYTS